MFDARVAVGPSMVSASARLAPTPVVLKGSTSSRLRYGEVKSRPRRSSPQKSIRLTVDRRPNRASTDPLGWLLTLELPVPPVSTLIWPSSQKPAARPPPRYWKPRTPQREVELRPLANCVRLAMLPVP